MGVSALGKAGVDCSAVTEKADQHIRLTAKQARIFLRKAKGESMTKPPRTLDRFYQGGEVQCGAIAIS